MSLGRPQMTTDVYVDVWRKGVALNGLILLSSSKFAQSYGLDQIKLLDNLFDLEPCSCSVIGLWDCTISMSRTPWDATWRHGTVYWTLHMLHKIYIISHMRIQRRSQCLHVLPERNGERKEVTLHSSKLSLLNPRRIANRLRYWRSRFSVSIE